MGYYLTVHGYKNGKEVISEFFGKLWGYQGKNDEMLSMRYLLETSEFKEYINDAEKEYQGVKYSLYEAVHDIYFGASYCISGEFEITKDEFVTFSFFYLKDYQTVFENSGLHLIPLIINILREKPDKIGLEWGVKSMSNLVFHFNIYENNTMFSEDKVVIDADRRDFVHNVGVLAAQTRDGVDHIEYIHEDDQELAKIVFKKGADKFVNITHDSFTAIVRDIFKHI